MKPLAIAPPRPEAPLLALDHLDDLWFQVAGTLCNLTCRHCFISCSPHNDRFGFLTMADVVRFLEESVRLGVKEYYFTGGEPFLNPETVPILVKTLEYGPATVLTNGTVFRPRWLEVLSEAEARSPYSLEFRVSIDGYSPETNDPIRGEGTFARAMAGVRQLVSAGFLPIVTVTLTREEDSAGDVFAAFVETLRGHGYDRPRVKILPLLRIGAEENRCRSYRPEEHVTAEMLEGFDRGHLLCSHGRIVTDEGVHVCPILVDRPDARLGGTLDEAARAFPLAHGACYTCYQYGSICANPSAKPHDS